MGVGGFGKGAMSICQVLRGGHDGSDQRPMSLVLQRQRHTLTNGGLA